MAPYSFNYLFLILVLSLASCLGLNSDTADVKKPHSQLILSPDLKNIIASNIDGNLELRDLFTLDLITPLSGLFRAAFSSDGKSIVGWDMTRLVIIDLESKDEFTIELDNSCLQAYMHGSYLMTLEKLGDERVTRIYELDSDEFSEVFEFEVPNSKELKNIECQEEMCILKLKDKESSEYEYLGVSLAGEIDILELDFLNDYLKVIGASSGLLSFNKAQLDYYSTDGKLKQSINEATFNFHYLNQSGVLIIQTTEDLSPNEEYRVFNLVEDEFAYQNSFIVNNKQSRIFYRLDSGLWSISVDNAEILKEKVL